MFDLDFNSMQLDKEASGYRSAFHVIVEKSISGIFIFDQERIRFANSAFVQITGYSIDDLKSMSPWDMVHPDEMDKIHSFGLKRLKKFQVTDYYETRWLHENGQEIWVEVRANLLDQLDEPVILANIIDITEKKKAELALKKRETELANKSRRLNETNMALKVLMQQQNEEKEKLKENIVFNVEKLIMPHIDNLEALMQTSDQKTYIQSIKENLREITSPHMRTLSTQYASFTPKQLDIISFIRQGKTSKEIAKILNVSKEAVDFHRHNIRTKLGLKKKKINLSSFLDLAE